MRTRQVPEPGALGLAEVCPAWAVVVAPAAVEAADPAGGAVSGEAAVPVAGAAEQGRAPRASLRCGERSGCSGSASTGSTIASTILLAIQP